MLIWQPQARGNINQTMSEREYTCWIFYVCTYLCWVFMQLLVVDYVQIQTKEKIKQSLYNMFFSGFILKLCIYNTRAQNAFLVHFEYLPSWKVSCTCYKYASYTCTFYTWTYYTPLRLYFLHLYFLYFFTPELVIHMYIYISYTYLYFLPLYSLNLFCVKHILLT